MSNRRGFNLYILPNQPESWKWLCLAVMWACLAVSICSICSCVLGVEEAANKRKMIEKVDVDKRKSF